MTLGQSQWIGASDDLVLNAEDARIASVGQWAVNSAASFDVRTGLVWQGGANLLSGTSGLSVNVAAHHFLSQRGTSIGVYLGTNKSSTAVTVPAAPSLGSKRIDLIWVTQHDKHGPGSGDATTFAEYGVVTGTAGSSPSPPATPSGTVAVGTVTWDSTSVVAAATNAAQCTLATTGPWTVARGAAIPVRSATERDATITAPFLGMQVRRLDLLGSTEMYDGTQWLGGDTGWISAAAAGFTAASGFSALSGNVRRKNGVVQVNLGITTTSAIGAGNVTNTVIINVPTGWQIEGGNAGPVGGGSTGGGWTGFVSNAITLASTETGFAAGASFSVLGLYML